MMVTCICNKAFEDRLTEGKKYPILATGVNGFKIKDDKGEERDYGAMKFKYVRNDV